MNDPAFRDEVLTRLARMETKLDERCSLRAQDIATLRKDVDVLIRTEEQRKGGKAMLAALCALSGAFGGLAAKLLPAISGR